MEPALWVVDLLDPASAVEAALDLASVADPDLSLSAFVPQVALHGRQGSQIVAGCIWGLWVVRDFHNYHLTQQSSCNPGSEERPFLDEGSLDFDP